MTTRPSGRALSDPRRFEHGNGNGYGKVVVYSPGLTGEEIWDVITALENAAKRAENYVQISECVLAAETVRERAKKAGW